MARGPLTSRRAARLRTAIAAGTVVAGVLLAACGGPRATGPGATGPGATVRDPGAARAEAAPSTSAPAPTTTARPAPAPAGTGRPAPSGTARFVPAEVSLGGGGSAPVVPTSTVDGELVVPDDSRQVAWWDGGAQVGDPFGSVVLAGHINDERQLGFLSALLDLEPGDMVTVSGADDQGRAVDADYRVVSSTLIDKGALATQSDAFEQRLPHRLVLITCSGTYRPDQGGYDSNLVVVAEPVG